MANQQRRYTEPECDAQQLQRRHAQGTMLVERQEGQNDMRSGGAIEEQRTERALPNDDGDAQSPFSDCK